MLITWCLQEAINFLKRWNHYYMGTITTKDVQLSTITITTKSDNFLTLKIIEIIKIALNVSRY